MKTKIQKTRVQKPKRSCALQVKYTSSDVNKNHKLKRVLVAPDIDYTWKNREPADKTNDRVNLLIVGHTTAKLETELCTEQHGYHCNRHFRNLQ